MLLKLGEVLHGMQEKKRDERGFTLIELLVVVIIIGILAAIAIPVFLSQREGAWESAAQSDLRNAATAQESYLAENDAYADVAEAGDLADFGYNNSADITFEVISGDADNYCMSALHTSGGETFYLHNDSAQPNPGAPSTTVCT